MNILVASELPSNAVASPLASRNAAPSPAADLMARLIRSAGSEKSALRVKSPGKISAVLTTTAVSSLRTAASTFLLPETTKSQPSTRSASPAATRIAWMSDGVRPSLTWL